MVGEVLAAAAAAAPLAPELAWSPSTMTDADIEALVDTLDVVGSTAFSLRQGGKCPEASFKDNNKQWVEEWFVVANPAPGLPPRTGLPLVPNARWEEKPTNEEMVEVEVLLAELQKLKAEKLTGNAVALSFAKRLTQPIQEWVHPGYEYLGRDDPTRVQNRKVSRSKAHKRVTHIVSGEVRGKGCLKAYCLKRPTTEFSTELFLSSSHPLGCNTTRLFAGKNCVILVPCAFAERQQGKAVDPPAGLALLAADFGSFSSDSSIGSESDDVVEVSGPAAGAGSTTKKRRPTRKVAVSKAQRGGVTLRGRSSTPPGASRVGTEAAAEKAGLTTPKRRRRSRGRSGGGQRGRPREWRSHCPPPCH
ncbi:hypothetical protein C2845_PM09G10440 [Panicum miliaceum]|uniref:Gypsy-type retrotransposon protein n=1 Tax=Panicum miliaceum TaxID=4540 RepID=A0A3L6RXZ6_PANMI|nr:hypothetical protein C2845_PM09G10440 [Panicum miliaceum]